MKRTAMLLLACAALACSADDRTVAFVGRMAVLESDVSAVMKESGLSMSDAMETCVRERLLLLGARDAGIQVSSEEVDRAVDTVARRYPDRKKFLDDLAAAGLSPESLRVRLRDQLLVQKYLAEKVERTITVSTTEAMRAYGQVRALIPVEVFLLRKDYPSEDAARKAAGDRTQDGEEGFESVGWMRLNQMIPSVREAVASLAAGQMSAPVAVGDRWYLFIVKERRESPVPEEAIAAAARRQVFLEKYQQRLQSLLNELRAKYPVTVCAPS